MRVCSMQENFWESNEMKRAKPESVFEKAYACYPRHVAPRAAQKAWNNAVTRESKKRIATNAEHEDFIFQRVMQYSAACRRYGKPKEFTPYMATWLNQDRFLDDPSEWAVTQRGPNGNGKTEQLEAELAIGRNNAPESNTDEAVAYFRSMSDPNCTICKGSGHNPRGGACPCRVAKQKALAQTAGATAGGNL